ncbi:MAG TPA: EAL domain-containing protein [Gammaproteobacteria bacterium]|nr:EAL domain-containing protein [Gammaproteobacteria bacterium]
MDTNTAAATGPGSVLVIDDDETFHLLLKAFFIKLFPKTQIDFYNSLEHGEPPPDFAWGKYGLLVMDYDLGNGQNGLDWLRKYKKSGQFPATIMLTAHGNEELAVDAMRFGAQDYINKSKLSLERLAQAVNTALDKREKQTQLSNTMNLQSKIFNRVHFYKKIKDVIEHQAKDRHAFLLQIQINQYKEIYEKHGLLFTDGYIAEVTDVIAELLTNNKLAFNIVRMGDALIACLIHDAEDDQAGTKIAQGICEQFKQPLRVDEKSTIKSSVSIGIKAVDQTQDVDTLLVEVDRACQSAAQEKDGAFRVYAADLPAAPAAVAAPPARKAPGVQSAAPKAVSTPATVSKTRQASPTPPAAPAAPIKPSVNLAEIIKLNSIQPYYQPYIALSETAGTFKASYFQMQLNLVNKDGQMFKAQALKDMEITGGSPGTLDLWVTRHALAQLLEIDKNKNDRKCGLFIRLFEESLADDKLYNWMQDLIKKAGNPAIASTLVFELHPPEFMLHKKTVMRFINQMRDTWGISFALFDVVNTTVLDTCVKQGGFEFVKFIMDEKNTENIAKISAHAREAGVLTVIENISNAQELNTAIQMNFDYGQGDFIQPPLDRLAFANDVISM